MGISIQSKGRRGRWIVEG